MIDKTSTDRRARAYRAPSNLRSGQRLTVTVLFVTMLAGSFSLDRIDPGYSFLGPLGETRYWLVAILGLALSAQLIQRGNGPAKLLSGWPWLGGVCLVHLYMAAAVLWAPDPVEALDQAADIVLLILLLLISAVVFARSSEASVELVLRLFYWTSLLFLLGGLSGRWINAGRIEAFWGGANVFVRVMVSGIFAAFYLFLKSGRVRWLLPVPLLVLGAVLSGSRGGIIGMVSSILLYLPFVAQKAKRYLLPLVLVASVSVGVFYSGIGERAITFWGERFVQQTLQDRYLSRRDVLFEEAWVMFLEHPAIGVGLDGFKSLTKTGEEYPHNLVLTFAAEGGLVAALMTVVLLIVPFRRWARSQTAESVTCFWLGSFYFVSAMFSGTYYDARFMWLFFLLWHILTPKTPGVAGARGTTPTGPSALPAYSN